MWGFGLTNVGASFRTKLPGHSAAGVFGLGLRSPVFHGGNAQTFSRNHVRIGKVLLVVVGVVVASLLLTLISGITKTEAS